MRSIAVVCLVLLAGCSDLQFDGLYADPDWRAGTKFIVADVRHAEGNGCFMPILGSCDEQSGSFSVRFLLYAAEGAAPVAQLDIPVGSIYLGDVRSVSANFSSLANAANQYLNAVNKVRVIIDVGEQVDEASEDNNEGTACVAPDVPGRRCWMVDYCYLQPQDVHLVVRTVNTIARWPDYPNRLSGIDELFETDWQYQIGAIGMQEVKEEMNSCPAGASNVHGTKCFAAILAQDFGHPTTWTAKGAVGVVAGSEWQVIAYSGWELGKDSWQHFGNRSTRYLNEALLRHRGNGWVLRFYNTHLSHGDQLEQRQDQIDKLLGIITTRQRAAGELPPVLVGDFNFRPSSEAASFNKLNASFRLINTEALGCTAGKPTRVGIDQIWVGRRPAFPTSTGTLTLLRWHTSSSGNGIELDGLSDHDSPGASFRITYP